MKQILLENQYHTVPVTALAVGGEAIADLAQRDFICGYFREFLARGGLTIDTARIYGGGQSEQYVGQFIKEVGRDNVTLATKCAHPNLNAPGFRARVLPAETRMDLEKSLRELDVDCVDVLMLHRDDVSVPVAEIMPELDKFVREGKVKVLGVSNWTAGRIAAANRFAAEHGLTPFSISQINWSLALTTAAQIGDVTSVVMCEAEYAWYREESFPVMAWSASAKGFFSKVAAGREIGGRVAQRYGWLGENFSRARRAQALAAELGVPVGTLVLSYLLSDPVPTCAVTSFSNLTQFEEAMAATALTLTAQQRAYLEGR